MPILTLASVTLVSGLLATGAVYFSVKSLKSRGTRELSKDSTSINNETKLYDDAIGSAIKVFDQMVSLDEVLALQNGRSQLLSELEIEKQKLSAKEKKLEQAQAAVDKQEQRHSELKSGKEGSEELAQQIQQNKVKLETEIERIRAEIEQVKGMVEAYSKEQTDDSKERKAQLDGTLQTLSQMSKQLSDLVETYDLAGQRFVGLQKQYSELEKEYRRLVDRELSGDFSESFG